MHVFDEPALAAYATEAYARALAQVIEQEKPAVVLLPFTAMGKDLAPRVAARFGAGLVSDCVSLAIKDGALEARRPLYAGKAFATVSVRGASRRWRRSGPTCSRSGRRTPGARPR